LASDTQWGYSSELRKPRRQHVAHPHWIRNTWFALAALSTAYVAWDSLEQRKPEETMMKGGGVLITLLYVGPIGHAVPKSEELLDAVERSAKTRYR
jgi:hypothetical protein